MLSQDPLKAVLMLAAALLCAGALSAQAPNILYYKFNEGTGNQAINSAVPGQGITPATIAGTGSYRAAGRLGSSYDFSSPGNGINTYINAATALAAVSLSNSGSRRRPRGPTSFTTT